MVKSGNRAGEVTPEREDALPSALVGRRLLFTLSSFQIRSGFVPAFHCNEGKNGEMFGRGKTRRPQGQQLGLNLLEWDIDGVFTGSNKNYSLLFSETFYKIVYSVFCTL